MKMGWVAAVLVAVCLDAVAELPFRPGQTRLLGSWLDPLFSGQGLLLEELEAPGDSREDGESTLVGYLFTYDDAGNPIFVVGQGQLVDGVAEMTAVIPFGGALGPDLDPDQVVREPWGTFRIESNGCRSIDFFYQTTDGESGQLELVPTADAVGLDRAPDGCSPDKIIVENPKIDLRVCDAVVIGFCLNEEIPFEVATTRTVTGGSVGPGGLVIGEFVITPRDAIITVSGLAVDDSNPDTFAGFNGIAVGQVIGIDETVTVQVVSARTNGATETLNYRVEIDGISAAIDYTVELTTD